MARCTFEEGTFRCARQSVEGSVLCAEHNREALAAPAVETVEAVDHPAHYGGADDPYEAIKVIRAWRLGFNLGNTVKYISRAGKKDPAKTVEDLRKALWYLADEIAHLESLGVSAAHD